VTDMWAENARLRAQVARLRDDLAAERARADDWMAENVRLRADLLAAAGRIAKQSELLSGRAEKAPGAAQETRGGGGEGCGP
jgi:hypothetical protein